ncbi:MAG: acyl-ACP--UDP-N-acetylglucosamine O-acyltransferase [Chlorobi bacterium]|nr:acyl-ACP--UDP-N-acetylglucosamine O-acyltransferase [Chlorobiota bacterium]
MINKLANVHPNAKIADSAIIDAFVTIQEDVVIGERTHVQPNVVIMDGARIGNDVNIFPGAVISAEPQDLKYRGEKTTAEIGNNCIIREFVTINKGTAAKDKTIVGNNCLIMAYSHVAHDCILGNNIILANGVQLAGEVEVDDFAILGGGTLVHQFTRIGKHVMAQGGVKLTKDIPPYTIVAREPASFTGINSVGLRRRAFSNERIDQIKGLYRIIYNSGLNTKDALLKIESMEDSVDKDEIIKFIKSSNRGIISGYNKR